MRTFIQTTAGGTFYEKDLVTYITRKSYVEIVINTGNGWYGVVTVQVARKDRLVLFCNWGRFLYKFNTPPENNKEFSHIDSKCPKLYGLITSKSDCFILLNKSGEWSGIGKHVEIALEYPLLHAVTDKKVLDAAYDVLQCSLDVYHEIMNESPYDDWKEELKRELL